MFPLSRFCRWPLAVLALVSVLSGCAGKSAEVVPEVQPVTVEEELVSFSERALKEKVSDSLAIRPSWTYYQYALQAMENQEWLLARHYLDESLRQLVSERYDSTFKNVSLKEDSAYHDRMPLRIVAALDEVYPNIAELGENAENFVRNEVSIDGIDALDENEADSASLQVIESFLDTLDVSRFTLPVQFNDRVLQEIFYMTTTASAFMSGSLNRKTAYDSLIYAQLDAAKMPRDLIYLALVESGFKVKAYSRAKASGMWQFIPETGKRYGLEVDYWVDMRRNPEKATGAALKYLQRLHDEFGDWLLAMAAYNCGEGRVRRLLREMQEDSTRDQSTPVSYWELDLPKETMRYVPRILAAMVIGHYPEQYEMVVEKTELPDFDTVTVFDSFPLEEVANLLNVKEDTLRSLNMELVKWCTPPNRDSYLLRLPVGTRAAFVDGYDKMEKNNFSSWHHHKVRRGENLGGIARQYGIKISELQQANDMKSTRIRAGQTLLIPVKVTPKVKSRSNVVRKPEKVRKYVVQQGDNLASIARRFGISHESLRVWNSMDAAAFVKAGDTLFVSKPEPRPVQETSRPKLSKGEKYVVREGDSFAKIANAFDVPVFQLMQANQGFTRRLMVGDSLTVPEVVRHVAKPASKNSKAEARTKSAKAAPPTLENGTVYVVQPGDNLTAISRKFGTTVAKLQSLNNMGQSTNLNVGQRLKVNGEIEMDFRTHVVKKGEGLWDISRLYNVTIEEIVKWNGLKDTKIKVGEHLKIRR